MRVLLVGAASLGAIAASGTRPVSVLGVQSSTSIGRDALPKTPSFNTIDPNEVTVVGADGARFFLDGALVGLWRSLRSQSVVGPLELGDNDVQQIEPSWEGNFVPVNESAATWAENESQKGRYVIAPIFLAYDTSAKRYLWSSKDSIPAQGNGVFAVLLSPYARNQIRSLANEPESGG